MLVIHVHDIASVLCQRASKHAGGHCIFVRCQWGPGQCANSHRLIRTRALLRAPAPRMRTYARVTTCMSTSTSTSPTAPARRGASAHRRIGACMHRMRICMRLQIEWLAFEQRRIGAGQPGARGSVLPRPVWGAQSGRPCEKINTTPILPI